MECLQKTFRNIDNSDDQIQSGITGPDSPNMKMFEAIAIPDSNDTSGQ